MKPRRVKSLRAPATSVKSEMEKHMELLRSLLTDAKFGIATIKKEGSKIEPIGGGAVLISTSHPKIVKAKKGAKLKPKYRFKKGTPVKVVYRGFPYVGRFVKVLSRSEVDACGYAMSKVWYEIQFCDEVAHQSERHVAPIDGLTETLK
jgi:hypothetical protein